IRVNVGAPEGASSAGVLIRTAAPKIGGRGVFDAIFCTTDLHYGFALRKRVLDGSATHGLGEISGDAGEDAHQYDGDDHQGEEWHCCPGDGHDVLSCQPLDHEQVEAHRWRNLRHL